MASIRMESCHRGMFHHTGPELGGCRGILASEGSLFVRFDACAVRAHRRLGPASPPRAREPLPSAHREPAGGRGMIATRDQWRLASALAASLASYGLDRSPRPFSATFSVTNRCNLRCTYCNTPFLDPRDLSLTEIDVVFRKLKKLGVVRLGLAGGEPLVRDDIEEIVRLARAQGFWISVNTNLNLYDRHEAAF